MGTTTYHCDKLCSGECCAPLRYGLDRWMRAPGFAANLCDIKDDEKGPNWPQQQHDALLALSDPAKLADLGAMALRARGFSVVVVAPDIQRWKAPNHLSIRWHDDEIGVYDDGLLTCLVAESYTLAEFRALVARTMATLANESSREQAERLIRGES